MYIATGLIYVKYPGHMPRYFSLRCITSLTLFSSIKSGKYVFHSHVAISGAVLNLRFPKICPCLKIIKPIERVIGIIAIITNDDEGYVFRSEAPL